VGTAFVAALLVGLLPFAFGLTYTGRDLFLDLLPARCIAEDPGLFQGFLLPQMGLGAPLLSLPAAQPFYPLFWIFSFLPPDHSASFHQILHLALGAGSVAWLARLHAFGPTFAALTGLFFAFSGVCTDLIVHTIYSVGAAFIPLAWAATRASMLGRGGRWAPFLLALALILSLLGGDPHSTFMAGLLVVIECLRHIRNGYGRGKLLPVAGVVVCAGIMGLAVWWPTLAELRLTARGAGLSDLVKLTWSFAPETWPALIWPGVLNTSGGEGVRLWRIVASGESAQNLIWNPNPFVGSIFLVLAAAGFSMRRHRGVFFTFAFFFILALGGFTPVGSALLTDVPPFSFFRYPAKYLVPAQVAACLLVSLGARRLARGIHLNRAAAMAALLFLVHCGGLFLVLVEGDTLDAQVASMVRPGAPALFAPLSRVVLQSMGQGFLPLVAVALFFFIQWRRGGTLGVRAWAAVVVVEMFLGAFWAVELTPPLAPQTSPLVQATKDLPQPAVVCVTTPATLPHQELPEAEIASRFRTLLRREIQTCDGLTSGSPYGTAQRSRAQHLLQSALEENLAAAGIALTCDLVVSFGPLHGDGFTALDSQVLGLSPEAFENITVSKRDSPTPLAEIIKEPRPIDEQLLKRALARLAPSSQATRLVDFPGAIPDALPTGGEARVAGARWDRAGMATVQLAGKGGAVVALRSSFQFGWSARQAGQSLETIRIAGQRVAAVVPDVEGGDVVFAYAPPQMTLALIGFFLGSLGTLLWVGLFSLLGRQRRNPIKDIGT
jgi:hypothetical protein